MGLWDWDLLTNTVYFSPSWEALFGHEVGTSEQIMESFSKLVHPDDLDGMFNAVTTYLATDAETYSREFRMFTLKGDLVWTLHCGKKIKDSIGNVVRMVGLTTDITERKKTEEYIRNQNEDLSTSLQITFTQRLAIASQKKELEEKNKKIIDSITYAQRIQSAILPSKTRIEESLGVENFFILYHPKDIVSGDFYWFKEI